MPIVDIGVLVLVIRVQSRGTEHLTKRPMSNHLPYFKPKCAFKPGEKRMVLDLAAPADKNQHVRFCTVKCDVGTTITAVAASTTMLLLLLLLLRLLLLLLLL